MKKIIKCNAIVAIIISSVFSHSALASSGTGKTWRSWSLWPGGRNEAATKAPKPGTADARAPKDELKISDNGVFGANGLGVIGKINHEKIMRDANGTVIFIKTDGPTKLVDGQGQVLPGHTEEQHFQGYSTPIGKFKIQGLVDSRGFENYIEMNQFNMMDLKSSGLNYGTNGSKIRLEYESGIVVEGIVKDLLFDTKDGSLRLIKFVEASVMAPGETLENASLFKPDWGEFDLLYLK